jgi:hypothetical protein
MGAACSLYQALQWPSMGHQSTNSKPALVVAVFPFQRVHRTHARAARARDGSTCPSWSASPHQRWSDGAWRSSRRSFASGAYQPKDAAKSSSSFSCCALPPPKVSGRAGFCSPKCCEGSLAFARTPRGAHHAAPAGWAASRGGVLAPGSAVPDRPSVVVPRAFLGLVCPSLLGLACELPRLPGHRVPPALRALRQHCRRRHLRPWARWSP